MITLFWPYISKRVASALAEVLSTRWIGQGPKVDDLEQKFSGLTRATHSVAVNSCTSALHLSLILAGVQEGDEVVTTPLTCSATNIPILYCRAKPVFADLKEETLNIDPGSVASHITKKTKTILAVHWGGEPCDLDEIHRIAQKHDLPVVEDAAHALGATYHGKPIGSISNFTCFSFQAIKQITSGDGGMLTLQDPAHAKRAKLLRWYAMDRTCKGDIYEKHQIREVGFKYHMNDIVATMAMVQLDDLVDINKRRGQLVDRYRTGLAGVAGLTLLRQNPDRESGNWLFTVLVKKREAFMKKLASEEIETSLVHVRCDLIPIFGGRRQPLPVMDRLEKEYVCIPLHNRLADDDIGKVIRVIRSGW